MPRPRQGVTSANILNVDSYFSRALKDNRLFTRQPTQNFDLIFQAKEAFFKLPPIDWKNETTKKKSITLRIAALQQWIDQYVDPKKWQRCLLTLRQNKSRKKLKLRRLDLQMNVYLTVKILAKSFGLSLNDTIDKLAKPALNKIYKNQLIKVLGKKKF